MFKKNCWGTLRKRRRGIHETTLKIGQIFWKKFLMKTFCKFFCRRNCKEKYKICTYNVLLLDRNCCRIFRESVVAKLKRALL